MHLVIEAVRSVSSLTRPETPIKTCFWMPVKSSRFNIVTFDLASQLIARELDGGGMDMKFVVKGGIMCPFSAGIIHRSMFDDPELSRFLPPGRLACAGHILLDYSRESPSRAITGYSDSLEDARLLPKEKSDWYKSMVLQWELGKYFKIM